MIFQTYVETLAREAITQKFGQYPGAIKYLLGPEIFKSFCERLTVRCNELDLSGIMRDKLSLDKVIVTGALVYGAKHLRKVSSQLDKEASEAEQKQKWETT